MNQIKVKMKDVAMDGVFVCDENGGYKKIDDSEISNVKGENVGLIAFTLSNGAVLGGYSNVDLLCSSRLSNESDSYTYHFSIHNNETDTERYLSEKGGSEMGESGHYPIDHFDIYDAPLADKGINYSENDDGGNNVELTFEVNESNFQLGIGNYHYGFSVNYI